VTRRKMLWLVGGALCLALVVWVARNTEWTEIKVPMPLQGEAAQNPLYAAQRLAEQLGARATWDRQLIVPSTDAAMVLADWHWSLSTSRRAAIERWVEAGGRLVVDSSVLFDDDFREWSRIRLRAAPDEDAAEPVSRPDPQPQCRALAHGGEIQVDGVGTSSSWLCDVEAPFSLTTSRKLLWQLADASGAQAIRVAVGAGHVTAFNASPFTWRQLFNGDHGVLFVVASQLRRGDEVHFLSEFDHPSLLALVWRHGAPVVVIASVLIGAALWRSSARFGPLMGMPDPARRSIAEQIRGTGYFAARHGGGEALHAACVRALDEAAARRVAGYRRLAPPERAAALARLTGFDSASLMSAIHDPRLRGGQALTTTIAMLETARRRALDRTATRHLPDRDHSATLEISHRYGSS
jgi:hypothetical protein